MTNDIIYCGGKYEVHPMVNGGYGVVNSESGDVRCTFASQAEAVSEAKRLNIDTLADEHEQDCYEDDGEAAYGRED